MEIPKCSDDFRKKAADVVPTANWFGLGTSVFTLTNLFPREKPLADNYSKDVVKKLEALIDPDDNWPYDVSIAPHAANDAYVNSEIDKAEQDKDDKKFMRFYRKYILHSVEDAVAMLCTQVLAIAGRYGKSVGDIEYRDEHRESEFIDIFRNSSDRDICDFLRRKVRDIMHRECETEERNRESDFQYVLSFLFSFAVRLGIKNIEWYIQKRINFEMLRAVEKLKRKSSKRNSKRTK
jgi:hypothetical protein